MKAHFGSLSIRWKFVVAMIAALAVMLISVYVYFPTQHKRTLFHAYAQYANRTAELVAVAVTYALEQHSFELLQNTLQNAKVDSNILFIVFTDEKGEELAAYRSANEHGRARQNGKPAIESAKHKVMVVEQTILNQEGTAIGTLSLAYDLHNLEREVSQYHIATIIFTVVSFVLGFIFINRISHRIVRSISQLHSRMEEIIQKGNYSNDLIVTRQDEVGRLAAAFNKMMDELRRRHQRLVESQKRYRALNMKLKELNRLKSIFVSDVSHHLRTPLTIIQGEIEVALQKRRNPREYRSVLEIILQEMYHLSRIVENLLTLAKAETGNLVLLQRGVNLTKICERQIRNVQALAKEKGLTFDCHIEKNCIVTGDPNRLSEVIFNLLENAVKYTPKNEVVTVHMKRTGDSIVLRVTDNGIGIPKEDSSRIFEKFYRASNSRRGARGTGLGLTICRSIVKAHGGKIRVSSHLGKGSTFEVHLKHERVDPQTPHAATSGELEDWRKATASA